MAFDAVEFNDVGDLEAKVNDNTAGIMFEIIQGEGGVRVINPEFVDKIKQIARAKDILIVIDEVQTGVARTGRFFAYEHYDIQPDIVTSAKGIGGGFPLGACLATEEVAKSMGYGSHGTTYGGNPLATAVANTVLDVIEEENLLDSVKQMSRYLIEGINDINYKNVIQKIRGIGLMLGLEISAEHNNEQIVDHLIKNQVLTIPAAENVVRILPPLNVNKAECDVFIKALDKVVNS